MKSSDVVRPDSTVRNARAGERTAGQQRPLLSVRHLRVRFKPRSLLPWKRRGWIDAVDDLHLDLRAGETLGIIGETGSGKSTLARALSGLQATTSGSLRINGEELAGLARKESRPLRRDVQMVSEAVKSEFGRKKTLGDLVGGPLKELFPEVEAGERAQRVAAAIRRVGLTPEFVNFRARELDPEQVVRMGIARALIAGPKLLICDEPFKGLDAQAQESIAQLLATLRSELGIALVLIAKDLATIRRLSTRVVVMYFGKIMEQAPVAQLFGAPRHPYTRGLLVGAAAASDITQPRSEGEDASPPLTGEVPNPLDPPMGCAFHTRCPFMEAACVRAAPNLRRVGAEHYAACHFVGEA